MTDKEGALRMQSNRRCSIVRPGRAPYELTSGDVFRVEVGGKLVTTRMEFAHGRTDGGAYYSVDEYELRSGMRAAIGTPRSAYPSDLTRVAASPKWSAVCQRTQPLPR